MTAPAVSEEVFTLADMFRETARMIRGQHGPGCPDAAAWEESAALLDDTADRLDAGEQTDTSDAYETARAYLTGDQPEQVTAR